MVMEELNEYVASDPTRGAATTAELDALVERYEWFTLARILRARRTGMRDRRLELIAEGRGIAAVPPQPVDTEAMMRMTDEEVIDRFLRQTDLRIVADKGAPDEEIPTEPALDEEDDVVSEELAEVYLAQGLRSEALAIYRRLSLLNPEKSVYFAEIIRRIETNN